jgi:CHAT domain
MFRRSRRPGRGGDPDPADVVQAFLALREAYLETGDPNLLLAAPEFARYAVLLCPPGHPRRVRVLAEACILLRMAYEATGNPPLLAEAIRTGRLALAQTPASDPAYPGVLSSLGNALQDEFERAKDPAALTEAAECYRTALRRLPPSHPELPGMLTNLANTLLRRAQHSGDNGSLDEAIAAYRRALHAGAPGSLSYANTQANLGSALMLRLTRDASMVTLNEAAQMLRGALDGLPAGHPGRAGVAAQLDLLDQARATAADRSPDSGDHGVGSGDASGGDGNDAGGPGDVINTASSMLHTYESKGDLSLLTAAIGLLRPLLAADRPGAGTSAEDSADAGGGLGTASPLDPVSRCVATHTLGTALWSLFERTGDLAVLNESADLLQAAAGIDDAPVELRLSAQANLAVVLSLRAWRTARRSDMERAVELARALVVRTPTSDPHYPGRLAGLAGTLRGLAHWTGDSGLAREAVEVQRSAIAAHASADDASGDGSGAGAVPPLTYSDLGLYLMAVYQISGDRAALDEAVEQCRRAVTRTNPAHLLYPRFQANLGLVLNVRYQAARDAADLTAAADTARSAFAATPADHPNRAQRAMLLADVLWCRFSNDRDRDVLDEVIETASIAAAAAPAGHEDWARIQTLLARAHTMRALDVSGDPAELTLAAALLREIAANASVPVSERVWAAWLETAPLLAAADHAGALRALTLAVELLPRVARRNLARADQERPLAQLRGLASTAAAVAIGAGKPELALTLLEQGRGILLSRALDSRADLTALKDSHPGLAADFERLRDLLDPAQEAVAAGEAGQAGAPAPSLAHTGLSAQRRDALAAEWDDLLARIRSLPGFGDFLMPPGVADLAARCTRGPVAVINLSDLRCDALILTVDGLKVVPLPELSFGDAAARAREFRSDVAAAWRPGPAADRVAGTLSWLWDTIAAPVLNAIGAASAPAEGTPWPRLWWVPTGPLAFLPLHAAGHPADDPAAGSAVLDRVISSYLPTVRSLPAPADLANPVPPTAVAVAMPSTPDADDLGYAAAEVAHLAARVPGTEVLTGDQATGAAVRDALARHTWAHFACHAVSSTTDAAAAQLLLYDHRHRPLTVGDIAALRNGRAELAYLSACDTAHGPVGLADEAVHLTGTFHMAGYAHVIGTLWSVADQVAAEVARSVYKDITTPVPDAAQTAQALHHAIREVRARYRDTPALWAAYIHVGP